MQHQLRVPELGMGDEPIALCLWLVRRGTRVTAGMPLAEILCGPVTIDLPSPADGILTKKLVSEGDRLTPGQSLAVVEETVES